ncbi:MAG TPA: hypothetical protein ENJ95_14950 [Bacteroidetes bacterium]|nr:hypothetical protein [Bacteroidota bacterium]
MKNILIVSILLFLSCSVSQKTIPEKKNENIEGLAREFKTVFFYYCVSKSYKEDRWGDTDISFSHDLGLGLNDYRLIDSLSTITAQKIYLDSVKWTDQMCGDCSEIELKNLEDEGMIGKRTLRFCLDYYTSNELDSIARANVKEYKW